MKNSICTIGQGFNMHRMLREYLNSFYLDQISSRERLLADKGALVRDLVARKKQIDALWPSLKIRDFFPLTGNEVPTSGKDLVVDCYVELSQAAPDLFKVEAVHHYGHGMDRFEVTELPFVERYEDGVAKYSGALKLSEPGSQELGVRLVPGDELFRQTYPEYIKWGE